MHHFTVSQSAAGRISSRYYALGRSYSQADMDVDGQLGTEDEGEVRVFGRDGSDQGGGPNGTDGGDGEI